ncbi:MAG: helix-turn-helix domain-containing protein [Bacteroidota bacterium]
MQNDADFEIIMDRLREEIFQRISDKGLSHSEFSRITGISRNTLTNFLNGHANAYFQTIFKLAIALDISLDEFIKFYQK